jgi:hypothetical protein
VKIVLPKLQQQFDFELSKFICFNIIEYFVWGVLLDNTNL